VGKIGCNFQASTSSKSLHIKEISLADFDLSKNVDKTIIFHTPQNPAMPTPPIEHETNPTTPTKQEDNSPTTPNNTVSPVIEEGEYPVLTALSALLKSKDATIRSAEEALCVIKSELETTKTELSSSRKCNSELRSELVRLRKESRDKAGASKKELDNLRLTNEILATAQASGAIHTARLKSEHAAQLASWERNNAELASQLKRSQDKISRDQDEFRRVQAVIGEYKAENEELRRHRVYLNNLVQETAVQASRCFDGSGSGRDVGVGSARKRGFEGDDGEGERDGERGSAREGRGPPKAPRADVTDEVMMTRSYDRYLPLARERDWDERCGGER